MTHEDVTITCADGYTLHGRFFRRPRESTRLPVLLSPATGVPQRFYQRFCEWLAEQGHDVLVFDYRGIGRSLPGHVRDSGAQLHQWGQLDQVAALDWLRRRCGVPRVLLLGHSAGGQMMGLMPNHDGIERVVAVSGSTGHFGGMPWRMRLAAHVLMRGWIPLSVRLFGYGISKAIGWGEDLPAGVALQWAAWCSRPGYAANAVGSVVQRDFHADVRAPITVLHATDDPIATRANVDDLLRLFPNAPRERRPLEPRAYGYPSIGHIDMFRASRERLWPVIGAALQP